MAKCMCESAEWVRFCFYELKFSMMLTWIRSPCSQMFSWPAGPNTIAGFASCHLLSRTEQAWSADLQSGVVFRRYKASFSVRRILATCGRNAFWFAEPALW